MPILDLHEDDLISASEAAPAVAPRKQDPAFSAWATVKSAVKQVPAAVAEVTGSTADILGAFGGVAAATGGSAGGMFSTGTDAERKQTADAAKKLREQGPDYRTEAGGLFRGVAKDYMPDATTAHSAEVAVADFVRMATKAVVGGVVAGPVAGALAAGAEEGFTAADKLADQGVDVNTRTQVGLVTGAVTGLGFALPVAGRTVGRTVGLALAGGPASFVAQNAATREILKRADYTQLADQYDPFDPVGLTLSTLVPLGFGALAMRGAARRAAAGQPVPEMAPVAPEVVDAARVQLLRENVDVHRATPPEDFAAAQAHEAAVSKALDQLANGQRVEVAQMVKITPKPADVAFKSELTDSYGGQTNHLLTATGADGKTGTLEYSVYEGRPSISMISVPESSRRSGIGRALVQQLQREYPGTEIDWGYMTDDGAALRRSLTFVEVETPSAAKFKELEQAIRERDQLMTIADDFGKLKEPTEAQRAEYWKQVEPLNALHDRIYDLEAELQGQSRVARLVDASTPTETITQAMADRLAPVAREVEALRQVEAVPAPVAALDVPATPDAPRFDIDAIARQAADFLSDGRSPAEVIGRMQASGQTIAPELQNMIADAVERMRAGQPVDAAPAKTSDVQARLDAEIVWNPDALDVKMPTAFDEAGKVSEAITAREFLDAVKAEADQEAADANLLQVAATCFLTSGA